MDECDVNCIVCCKLSPVSDPRLIVLRRRPRCPAVNPDGNPDGNPEEIPPRLSPKNLTIGGMTNHAHWSTSAYIINIQYVSYVNLCIMVQFLGHVNYITNSIIFLFAGHVSSGYLKLQTNCQR